MGAHQPGFDPLDEPRVQQQVAPGGGLPIDVPVLRRSAFMDGRLHDTLTREALVVLPPTWNSPRFVRR